MKPGEDGIESFIPQSDLRITNVALGAELQDENARSTIKIHYKSLAADDEDEDEEDEDEEKEDEDGPQLVETVLASLTPGKVCCVFGDLNRCLTLGSQFQIEQANVDVVLEEDVEVLFEVVGKKYVYTSFSAYTGADRLVALSILPATTSVRLVPRSSGCSHLTITIQTRRQPVCRSTTSPMKTTRTWKATICATSART